MARTKRKPAAKASPGKATRAAKPRKSADKAAGKARRAEPAEEGLFAAVLKIFAPRPRVRKS